MVQRTKTINAPAITMGFSVLDMNRDGATNCYPAKIALFGRFSVLDMNRDGATEREPITGVAWFEFQCS